jgi:Cof subfamily protein (haloacid dehalogenase superfamily)
MDLENKTPKYALVALDLDGTTLDSKSQISPATCHTLRKLSAMGTTIMLATGRGYATVLQYIPQLDLPQEKVHICCYNGSVTVELAKDMSMSKVFDDSIPASDARMLIDVCSSDSTIVLYYNSNNGDIIAAPKNDHHRQLLAKYASMSGKKQMIVEDYEEAYATSGSAKLLALTPNPDELMELVAEKLPGMFHMIRASHDVYFVEFLPKDICKGNGLKRYCGIMGIELSAVVAFGDGDNDLEMIECVGCGVAMCNATERLKSVADRVLEVRASSNPCCLAI